MLKCLFCKHKKQCKDEFREIERNKETIQILTSQLDEYEHELQRVQRERDMYQQENMELFDKLNP